MTADSLFAWPAALPLILLAPAIWLALVVIERHGTRRLARLIGARTPVLTAELDRRARAVRRILFALALALALVAVAQPSLGIGDRRVEQRGVDVMICLDVSRSMLARDVPPNRLARAQRDIRALAMRTHRDRLGLVAFAGDARLVVPMTRDAESFAELVEQTDPTIVERGGTDLGAALDRALAALERGAAAHQSILLVTDGEDLEERGLAAAARCAERGVVVHCVGIGSRRGSKIAIPSEHGETFLRDPSGDEVVTALDPGSLRAIADAAGGKFVDASAVRDPLLSLYEAQIQPMATRAFEAELQKERVNRYQWPLCLAFLLWLMEFAIRERRR